MQRRYIYLLLDTWTHSRCAAFSFLISVLIWRELSERFEFQFSHWIPTAAAAADLFCFSAFGFLHGCSQSITSSLSLLHSLYFCIFLYFVYFVNNRLHHLSLSYTFCILYFWFTADYIIRLSLFFCRVFFNLKSNHPLKLVMVVIVVRLTKQNCRIFNQV